MTERELDRLLRGARRMAAPEGPPVDFTASVLAALRPRALALWTRGMLAGLSVLLAVAAIGAAAMVTRKAATPEPPALTLYQGSGLAWPGAR